MKTAIVVLNYNGLALMQQFLAPLIDNSPQASIYVADNGSSDDSLDWLKRHHPEVNLIDLGENLGYAGGYNAALKLVDADIIALLNNDIKVGKNWLPPMIEAFEKQPDLVAAQPKIKDLNDPQRFEYAGAAGGYLDLLGYPFCRGRIVDILERDDHQYDKSQGIFWASGACLFLRREAFERVGGFDQDLFAHQEEIDLCWRLQTQGGQIQCIPSSVYHLGGGTLGHSNAKKTFLNFRNSLLILVKNVGGIKIFGIVLMRLLLDGLAGLVFLIQGRPKHTLAIIKAHFSFYQLLPKFLVKRKKWKSRLKYARISSILYARFFRNIRYFHKL